MTLEGRTLPQPTVTFLNERHPAYNGKSKWNCKDFKFRKAGNLTNWACLNIHTGDEANSDHKKYVDTFINDLKKCGMEVPEPRLYNLSANKTGQLDALIQRCQPHGYNHPFLLVVLPNDNSQLYNRIKQLGDRQYGIQTVCVVGLSKKFYSTSSLQYNANVALKVNVKTGGVNHVLEDTQLGFIGKGKTMVVGIDVTHPSPGSEGNASSIAAMVASIDKDLGQWPAEIRINPARQEKVDLLRPMLENHLLYWKEKHGVFPENLLIYRDGVSEGQYQMVLEEELPQIRQACRSAYGKQKVPKVTLIIVGKRHHTRFYRTDKKGIINTTNSNPPFGTVSSLLLRHSDD